MIVFYNLFSKGNIHSSKTFKNDIEYHYPTFYKSLWCLALLVFNRQPFKQENKFKKRKKKKKERKEKKRER